MLLRKTKKVIYYFLALYMIYIADSMFFSANSNYFYNDISKIIQILVGSISFIWYFIFIRTKISKIDLLLLLYFATTLTVTHLVNQETTIIALQKFSVLLFSYVLVKSVEPKKLIRTFLNVMVLISIVSLIGYIFVKEILSSNLLPILVNSKDSVFASGLLTNLPISTVKTRNWGPFVEPGLYQGFLAIAIIFSLFFNFIKKKIIYVFIFSVTIITTFSTTGFVALALIILAFVFNSIRTSDKKLKLVVFFIAIGFIIVLFSGDTLNRLFYAKLFEDEVPERFLTIKYGLLAFLERPFFGYGENFKNASNILAGVDFNFTNSIIGNFTIFGIGIGTIFVIGYIKFTYAITKKPLAFVFLTLAIFAVLSGQIFIYSPLFHYIMMFGLIGNVCFKELSKGVN